MPTSARLQHCRLTTPNQKGFIVTFIIDETRALQVRQGTTSVECADGGSPRELFVRPRVRGGPGDVYNAEAVEEVASRNIAIEVARCGHPFAVVRPRGDRDPTNLLHQNVTFTVQKTARACTSSGSISAATPVPATM